MNRVILTEEKIHPEALKSMGQNHPEVVKQVMDAIKTDNTVVVGMKYNPFVKKACKALDEAKISYTYLGYGGYLSKWKERLAIKLWSGWPTYPQVFMNGKLIGGYDNLVKILKK